MVRADAAKRQRELLELLMLGYEPREAIARLGISARTARRYLADPDIAAELRSAQDDRLRALGRRSLAAATSALQTLIDTATSAKVPASVRVRAARSVLDVSLRMWDITELADRVARLEEAQQETA